MTTDIDDDLLKRPLLKNTQFCHFSSFSFMHSFFALRILCTSLRSKTSNRFSCELNSPTNGQKLNESHVPQQNICKPSFGRALLRREKNPNQQYGRMLVNQMALRDSRQSGGELRFRNRKHANKIERFDTEPYFRGVGIWRRSDCRDDFVLKRYHTEIPPSLFQAPVSDKEKYSHNQAQGHRQEGGDIIVTPL